ncbi:Glutamyl-tRNA(Gln) amidotransferase subunit A [Pigmentiphaga humi]|uniref:Glutamyl-tRNA(Gln) amidotransferase subunit A n=1 Tax=Pigmentiphaga humi TaxID=2478468 RepID=A0A3P4AYX1_9BURK|nr:amidase [Pigmentiphaga humi]VCU68035.1 Glutamyl-tRNA(Gln) amidotransferase subunit A [Pigmentiphaga humi]
MPNTIRGFGALLRARQCSSLELAGACIDRIHDPAGEGPRAFIGGPSVRAMAQAEAADRLIRDGKGGPLSGIPVSVKDLFDVEGETTRAGSRVLDRGPAIQDSPVVARLKDAGAVIVGRTNMSEFAFTGVGINPHYGTPRNPWDRSVGRIPGGSSSGAAVAVADGMAVASIGTDTGGSCRIPAALCGLVGFKPTAGAIPDAGMVPLSRSYDAVGSLCRSVDCCDLLDQVLRGETPAPLEAVALGSVRIGIPLGLAQDELDEEVSDAFMQCRAALLRSGAQLADLRLASFDRLNELAAHGGIVAVEAFAWHRDLLVDRGADYDPLVLRRLTAGAACSAADYCWLLRRREELRTAYLREMADYDILAMPTVPMVAPRIDSLEDTDEFYRVNRLLLRNTSPANAFNTCAISLPMPRGRAQAPIGMMLMGKPGQDRRMLAIAQAVARVIG